MDLNTYDVSDLIPLLANKWNEEVEYIESLEDEVRRQEEVINNQAIKIMEGVTVSAEHDLNKKQMAQLHARINRLEEQNTVLSANNKDLKSKCDRYKEDNASLQGELTLTTNKLTLSEKTVSDLNRKLEQAQEEQAKPVQPNPTTTAKVKKLEKQITQLTQERNSLKQKVEAASQEDPKKLKAKIVSLQDKNRQLLSAKEKLIKDNKEYRVEKSRDRNRAMELEAQVVLLEETVERYKYREQIGFPKAICVKESGIIALLPQRFKVSVDGVHTVEDQHHLIYSDRKGIWKQVSLDPNGELSIARPYSDHYAERTRKTIESVLPQASEEDREFMQAWLTRLRENDWEITDLDVLSLRAGKILSMEQAVDYSYKLEQKQAEEERQLVAKLPETCTGEIRSA